MELATQMNKENGTVTATPEKRHASNAGNTPLANRSFGEPLVNTTVSKAISDVRNNSRMI